MIDHLKVAQARANGICFLCSLCEYWHVGVALGLRDDMGELRCSKPKCCGPIWGGSFEDYKGPLQGNLHTLCFLCGQRSAFVAVPKKANADKVGVCSPCVEKIKQLTAKETKPGTLCLVIAEHKAEPDKYEVMP